MTRHAITSSTGPMADENWTRRPAYLLLLAFALVAVMATFLPATALGRATRVYDSSWGSGSFPIRNPDALAVDQANGDVYAPISADGSDRISRFTETGTPHNFTAGPNAGTNTLSGFRNVGTVAVDRSEGALNGDIFAVDGVEFSDEKGIIKVFTTDGVTAGALDGSGTSRGAFRGLCAVAVDQSNGDLYVGQGDGDGEHFGTIWRYTPKSPTGAVDDSDFTVTGIAAFSPCDIAAESGNVYAVNSEHVLNKYDVSSFVPDPSATQLGILMDKPVTAVYVDPSNGDVYADEGSRVAVFDSAGDRLYGFGSPHDFGVESHGVAVKGAASGSAAKVYVADPHRGGGEEIDVFGPVTDVPTLTHPPVATFGRDGTSKTSFSAGGISQLAFDQAARKLFALDKGLPGVFGFDASGPPSFSALSGFAPLSAAATGEPPGLAIDNSGLGSTGNLYFASGNTDLLYGFDSTGEPLGGAFPIDPSTNPGAPFGTPKDLCGTAVDAAGNVWVSNFETKHILKYSSAGVALSDSVDTAAQGRPCGLAFDSDDNLYIVVRNATVGGDDVYRYSAASGYSIATLIDSTNAIGIAIDASNDHLYVAHNEAIAFLDYLPYGWVDEYDSAGHFVDEFSISASRFTGVTVDATNHYVYVADGGDDKIHVFSPGVILPEVAIEAASGVTNTTATLHGNVGSQGIPLSDCRFEYVEKTAFNIAGFDDLSSGGSVSCNPTSGSIPADFATHSVSASVSGLTASRTYRFRLVAANASASLASSSAAFTTSGPAVVETVGAPIRTMTTAQLGGRVDPRNEAATYLFEYGDQGPCDSSPCTQTEPKSAGSSDLTVLVSEGVTGLLPNTTYHYRVVANNGNPDGAVFGADMTVTTYASEPTLSHGHFPGPPGSDRAYEQISPPDTGGNPVNEAMGFSADGNRSVYAIAGGTPLSDTGNIFSIYYAERTESAPHEGGWRPKSILPPRSTATGSSRWEADPDATLSSMIAGNSNEVTSEAEIWRLDSQGSPTKLFTGSLGAYGTGNFVTSDDGSRLVALLGESQDPDHPVPGNNLNFYDLTSGTPRLASLLPGGSAPPCGVLNILVRSRHTVTADGSQLFFSTGGSCGVSRAYVRDLNVEETKLLSPPPISGPECDAVVVSSSPNAAFFWTKSRLSTEDTLPSSCGDNRLDGDVYRVELADETLKCVTCVVVGQDADVYTRFDNGSWRIGDHLSISEDGSRLYFQSPNALLPGAPTTEAAGSTYRINLNTGDLAWVAGPDVGMVGEDGEGALTPDGATVLFRSRAAFLNPLNGSDNGGTRQYYRYDDKDRSLICLSCPIDGSPARASVTQVAGGGVRGGTPVSRDGEDIAFSTTTPLVGADQNTPGPSGDPESGRDVYEWRDGRYFLVTDGLTNTTPLTGGPEVSSISPDGRDLYFIAPAQYTPDALDGYRRLYDARIGGGFTYPTPLPPCPLEVCQGTPKGAPEEQAPGTGTFAGPGNLNKPARAICSKGKARRKGRCVAKKPKRAHKASHDRRTSR